MRIGIVTNNRDKKGLWRDGRILDRLLTSWGHEVHVYDFRDVAGLPRDHALYSAVIHLEMVVPRTFTWSDRHLWFVNPDWATRDRLAWADAFRFVLAKSEDGRYQLEQAGVKRVINVGFEAEDCHVPVKRERRFFHTWGGSIRKGTRQVLRAFELDGCENIPATLLFGSPLAEPQLRIEQNRCQFWVQPSSVEGFGHCIHEGLSCGAIVITSAGPPMNEVKATLKVRARRFERQNLADLWECRPEDLAEAIQTVWSMSEDEVAERSKLARQAYEDERASFRRLLREILETA